APHFALSEEAIGGYRTFCKVDPPLRAERDRAAMVAALADGESVLRHALAEADDAERMLAAIRQLGAGVDRSEPGVLRVRGVGGRWKPAGPEPVLNLNNAGTATRFLAAAALCGDGPVVIDGNARMRQRPIGELGEALRTLGATVEHLGRDGCPPMRVTPPSELAVEELEIGKTQSSQFVSALLLTATCLPSGLTLRMTGEITSSSYVRMTLELLEEVGANVRAGEDLRTLRVLPGLRGFELDVEPDASGATYFWGAGALLESHAVGVRGLRPSSSQGDAGFADLMGTLGASTWETGHGAERVVWVRGGDPIRATMCDMSDMPDAAVTLAVVLAFADGPSVVRGVRTLRVKETDRIAALQNEMAKIGVVIEADAAGDPDAMTITPPRGGVDCRESVPEVVFETYDDHRMAMALALVALRRPNVVIDDPKCVAKTFPGYFGELARLYE
ncbi:MAG: 3-phosphoshikimate 1-carboxyvinyltransferase, partial [Planctomycetota bacterium]